MVLMIAFLSWIVYAIVVPRLLVRLLEATIWRKDRVTSTNLNKTAFKFVNKRSNMYSLQLIIALLETLITVSIFTGKVYIKGISVLGVYIALQAVFILIDRSGLAYCWVLSIYKVPREDVDVLRKEYDGKASGVSPNSSGYNHYYKTGEYHHITNKDTDGYLNTADNVLEDTHDDYKDCSEETISIKDVIVDKIRNRKDELPKFESPVDMIRNGKLIMLTCVCDDDSRVSYTVLKSIVPVDSLCSCNTMNWKELNGVKMSDYILSTINSINTNVDSKGNYFRFNIICRAHKAGYAVIIDIPYNTVSNKCNTKLLDVLYNIEDVFTSNIDTISAIDYSVQLIDISVPDDISTSSDGTALYVPDLLEEFYGTVVVPNVDIYTMERSTTEHGGNELIRRFISMGYVSHIGRFGNYPNGSIDLFSVDNNAILNLVHSTEVLGSSRLCNILDATKRIISDGIKDDVLLFTGDKYFILSMDLSSDKGDSINAAIVASVVRYLISLDVLLTEKSKASLIKLSNNDYNIK